MIDISEIAYIGYVIQTFRSSGIRCSELMQLNKEDVNFFTNEVYIRHGKGDKARIALMSTEAKVHIMKYLRNRTDDNDALFVGLKKPHRRLGVTGIRNMLNRLADASDIHEKIFPHRFRHTMITEANERGIPDSVIQQLAGHEDITTTMMYTHISEDKIRQQYKVVFG